MERAHGEFLAASTPPPVAAAVAELEKQGREGSTDPPRPPAYEAFLEGLSEDFPPLSKGVLEAFEGWWLWLNWFVLVVVVLWLWWLLFNSVMNILEAGALYIFAVLFCEKSLAWRISRSAAQRLPPQH